MRRGTTPTFTITVDADLSGMNIYLTFKNGANLLTKTNDDISIEYEGGQHPKTTMTAILSQEETLAFASGTTCEVQVRAADDSGYPAIATTIGTLPVDRILLGGVLP